MLAYRYENVPLPAPRSLAPPHRNRLVVATPRRLASICFIVLACFTGACTSVALAPKDIPTQQQQYRLTRTGQQGYKLELKDASVHAPGAHEVLIRVRAVSLNRRDVLLMKGRYPIAPRDSLVPLSDGAGEIAAIGPGVSRFHVGDRVAGGLLPTLVARTPAGGRRDLRTRWRYRWMLTQYATLSEEGVVALPKNLSFEEGATLPCAAVTAWNGLVTRGRMQPGDYVLLEGTGGVSMFGLQFATLMGAKPIITSSATPSSHGPRSSGPSVLSTTKPPPIGKSPCWRSAETSVSTKSSRSAARTLSPTRSRAWLPAAISH